MHLTKDQALAAIAALEATGAYKLKEERRFTEFSGLAPLWIEELKPNLWLVLNNGIVRETTAVSEADAINKVRWNRFGNTPTAECGAFHAVCPFDVVWNAVGAHRIITNRAEIESRTVTDLFGRHTLTKSEALARIRRMAS